LKLAKVEGSGKRLLIYFVLILLSLIPLKLTRIDVEKDSDNVHESYDLQLAKLNHTDSVINHVLNEYSKKNLNLKIDTSIFVRELNNTIKQRFYHGLASYSYTDNWIAYLSSKVLWSHFAVVVKPNDILKYPYGLCSQQTMVFLEILRRKKIDFRAVGLGYKEGPGHFLCEVKYNGSWHLYDVTYEPNWEESSTPHQSLEYYLNNKEELYQVYRNKMDSALFYRLLTSVEYGKVNAMPGQNMALFHTITKALTYIIPLIILILLIKEVLKVRIGKD